MDEFGASLEVAIPIFLNFLSKRENWLRVSEPNTECAMSTQRASLEGYVPPSYPQLVGPHSEPIALQEFPSSLDTETLLEPVRPFFRNLGRARNVFEVTMILIIVGLLIFSTLYIILSNRLDKKVCGDERVLGLDLTTPVCLAPPSREFLKRAGTIGLNLQPVLASYGADLKEAEAYRNATANCNWPYGISFGDQGRCLCCWSDLVHSYGGAHCTIDNSAITLRTNGSGGADLFNEIYFDHNPNMDWRPNNPASGEGSSVAVTAALRGALTTWFDQYNVTSVIDAACGDFSWMRLLIGEMSSRGIFYVGGDIADVLIGRLQNEFAYAQPFIRFVPMDIVQNALWPVDLIVLRDVLFHLPQADVITVLENVANSGAKYLVSTSYPAGTNDYSGYEFGHGFRSFIPINLEYEPYNFPTPLAVIAEDDEAGRRIVGLWSIG